MLLNTSRRHVRRGFCAQKRHVLSERERLAVLSADSATALRWQYLSACAA
jgi:hypothetical protein